MRGRTGSGLGGGLGGRGRDAGGGLEVLGEFFEVLWGMGA